MIGAKYPFLAQPTQVIHVSGHPRDMGRQHAEQVGESAHLGMVRFYGAFWERILSTQPKKKWEQALFKGLKKVVDPFLVRRLVSRLPQDTIETLKGVSEGTSLPLDSLFTLVVLPDLLPLLQGVAAKFRPSGFIPVRAPVSFGCSSFVVRGKYFLHGRNLDFPGVAYWDRFPVLQMTQPKEGLRYIGITTAGVPISGITGVNEAQVSVSLHQHYCREFSLRGALPFVIGETILREARTLDQALEILRKHRVATAWAFIITDGKSREAVICECHPKAYGIRRLTPEQPVLSHSNYFQTKECQPAEYASTARMNWDNYARANRLVTLVKEAGEDLHPKEAVQFISEHYDPYWQEEKPFNRTVSQVYNIQSLVLDPEAMELWFAEGEAPIHLGEYQKYDLGSIFSGNEGRTETRYPGFRFKDKEKEVAKRSYIWSFVSAMDGDLESARSELDRSLEACFLPEAALTASVLEMKRGAYEKAAERLLKAKEYLETRVRTEGRSNYPPEYLECVFFLARTYDLLDRRSDAQTLYRFVATHPQLEDTNLQKMATKGGPYRPEKLDRIVMPYSTYIPFQ